MRATVDWSGVAAWSLGFGLIAVLGLQGGGFDPLVHDRVAIAVWWALFAGLLAGALPRRRPTPLGWAALGLLASLVAWTALSLAWTESVDRTSAELARVAGYLGVFALALFLRGPRGARRIVSAAAAAVAVVALVAVVSRLQPEWIPAAGRTAEFLVGSRERLSYPLNYWNALAALIAIGAPLLLHVASDARSLLGRGLAAAALPLLALASFLTLSRGGIAAALVALIVYLALAPDRLPKLLTLSLAAAGSAVLVALAVAREALTDGSAGPLARQQGDELIVLIALVCLITGLGQAALSAALAKTRSRPTWARARGRRLSLTAGAGIAALAVVALSLGVPNRAADALGEFKSGDSPGSGAQRLDSAAGQGRYQLWGAAIEQGSDRPLTGRGAGSFEYWWAREGEGGTVRDAHSLYAQTFGELGLVGLLLLLGFLTAVLAGGAREVARSGWRGRSQLAAALAGCVAFLLVAAFDWHWQIPVLPIAFLLLASVLLGSGKRGEGGAALRLPARAGLALAAPLAIAAIAAALSVTALLRESEGDFRVGELRSALAAAREAESVQPAAAGPRLQQSLVLEAMGELPAASAAALGATEREQTNWRHWLVLSRIEAKRGRAGEAVRAYRLARSLNPHFSLFGP